MVCGRRLAGIRRCCCFSQHCFLLFFILVILAVFIFNCTDITGMSSDWRSKWLKCYSIKAGRTPLKPSKTSLVSLQNKSLSLSGEDTNVMSSRENRQDPSYVSLDPSLVEYPYEYHFTINEPYACEQYKPFLVLMVPVRANNRAHRDIIRSTWGAESLVLNKVVKLFFLLGQQSGKGAEKLQEQLLQESKDLRDLIQSNFVDCYQNLTIKTMVMMEWLDTYCSGTPYAIKIDSDTFLNVPNLISMLHKAPKANYLTGSIYNNSPIIRDPKSKWYVPKSIFPGQYYPPYLNGMAYVFSLDMAKKLVEASKHVKSIFIEDVHLGLCMQHLGIPFTIPPDPGLFRVGYMDYNRCTFSKLIATLPIVRVSRVWAWIDFKRPGPYC